MIWEDEPIDHDAHAGTGILIALPIAFCMWWAIYAMINWTYDWILNPPCRG